MSNLLSIDWDWVTGDCSDRMNHGCCGWCDPPPWNLARGVCNPHNGWEKRIKSLQALTFHDGRLYVAECHADILRIVDSTSMDCILHLDSHYDDSGAMLCCGSWVSFLPKRVKTKRFRKSDELPSDLLFSDVFICHSAPWTPPALDDFFWGLVKMVSDRMGTDPEFIGHERQSMMKAWEEKVEHESVARRSEKRAGRLGSLFSLQ